MHNLMDYGRGYSSALFSVISSFVPCVSCPLFCLLVHKLQQDASRLKERISLLRTSLAKYEGWTLGEIFSSEHPTRYILAEDSDFLLSDVAVATRIKQVHPDRFLVVKLIDNTAVFMAFDSVSGESVDQFVCCAHFFAFGLPRGKVLTLWSDTLPLASSSVYCLGRYRHHDCIIGASLCIFTVIILFVSGVCEPARASCWQCMRSLLFADLSFSTKLSTTCLR